jgi:hypothetical protein
MMPSWIERTATGIRVKTGEVTVSQPMYNAALRDQLAMKRLEWIAYNYDKATPEERAWLDRVSEAIAEEDG